MNISSNFVPKKLVTFNDRDPPWMNDFVKRIKLNGNTKSTKLIKKWSHIQRQEARSN